MNEGGCNCGNPNHSLDNSSASTFDSDLGTSLHQYISLTSIYALNEDTLNSCQSIFKSYNDRFTLLPACSSDADDCELIIHVPFTEAVKLKYISIAGGQAETAPSSVKLFVNRNDVDFSNAHDLEPSQTLDLVNPDHHTEFVGTLDYAVKMNKFQSVSSLTLFFREFKHRTHPPTPTPTLSTHTLSTLTKHTTH